MIIHTSIKNYSSCAFNSKLVIRQGLNFHTTNVMMFCSINLCLSIDNNQQCWHRVIQQVLCLMPLFFLLIGKIFLRTELKNKKLNYPTPHMKICSIELLLSIDDNGGIEQFYCYSS